jgi:hypothetical protein
MAYSKGQSFAYKLAPSNASAFTKRMAHKTLPANNPEVMIKAALDTYGNVEIGGGTVNLGAPIQIDGGGGADTKLFKLKTQGKFQTIINGANNQDVIQLIGDPSVKFNDLDIRPLGTGHGIRSTAESVTKRGFWLSEFKNIFIRGDFSTHSGYAMYLEGLFRSVFENVEAQGIGNGVFASATDASFNPGNCVFQRCFMDLSQANGKGFVIWTPNTGGQANIITLIQCEAIDSNSSSTSSVGLLIRGSANDYYASKNIYVLAQNIENFNTGASFEHGISNTVQLNYVNVKTGGTMVKFDSQSQNNDVQLLSTYVPTGDTVTYVNDQYTGLHRNHIGRSEGYIQGTINVTQAAGAKTDIYETDGISGPGTISPILQNSRNANRQIVYSPNGTRYKVEVSNSGILSTTAF